MRFMINRTNNIIGAVGRAARKARCSTLDHFDRRKRAAGRQAHPSPQRKWRRSRCGLERRFPSQRRRRPDRKTGSVLHDFLGTPQEFISRSQVRLFVSRTTLFLAGSTARPHRLSVLPRTRSSPLLRNHDQVSNTAAGETPCDFKAHPAVIAR